MTCTRQLRNYNGWNGVRAADETGQRNYVVFFVSELQNQLKESTEKSSMPPVRQKAADVGGHVSAPGVRCAAMDSPQYKGILSLNIDLG